MRAIQLEELRLQRVDGNYVIFPIGAQKNLIFGKEVGNVEPFGREDLIRMINRQPKLLVTGECGQLREPNNGIHVLCCL